MKGLRWQTLASQGPRFSDRFAGDDPMSQNKRNEPDARRAYQVNEAAAAYGLSRSTLYKLMAIGKLRTVKIGGRRLIPVDAIEALLAGGVQ
jgi:excisionase family DNA binding protein